MSAGLLMPAGGSAAGAFGSLRVPGGSLPGPAGRIPIGPLPTLAFDLSLREAVGIGHVSAAVHLARDIANPGVGGDRRIAPISATILSVIALGLVLTAAATGT